MLTNHPAAELFPQMTADEFSALKADIKAHGVREAIYLHRGQIIDGRNRYAACRELDIECPTRDWDGSGSLIGFVLSLNQHRRHLSPAQLATVAQESLPLFEAEAKEQQRAGGGDANSEKSLSRVEAILPQASERHAQARDIAAKLVGVSPRYVQDAKKIKEASPETYEQVRRGEITIPAAMRKINPPPEISIKTVAIQYSNDAINILNRIPIEDPRRDLALSNVTRWIKQHS